MADTLNGFIILYRKLLSQRRDNKTALERFIKDIMNKGENYLCIPENVYKSGNLKANELVLYGLIYSMSQKDGYCWCSNSFFANTLHTGERNIERWIATLKKLSYISTEYEHFDGTKGIQKRKIYIIQKGADKNVTTYRQNCQGGTDKNGGEVPTKMADNNIIDNIKIDYSRLSVLEIQKYVDDYKLNVDAKYFYEYYSARNWKIDGKPVSDWKKLILEWHAKEKQVVKKSKAYEGIETARWD